LKRTSKRTIQRSGAIARADSGFTILECAIASLLMTIVGLGIAAVFSFSIKNNVSAADRELAMAVAQQRIEQLRNVVFTDSSLTATAGTSTSVVRAARTYTVVTTIADSNVVNGAATTKTITVKVTPNGDGAAWATSVSSIFGSVTLVSTRTSLTIGPYRG
jgi:Tfp pilus assembly protein PilV